MHVIVADEMQEFQVVEPVILVVAVFMMDFCLLIHGEEQSAVPTSSALMLEEFSSGCVQSDVRSFSCAPIAPVAIIRAYAFAQSYMSFDWGLYVPSQDVRFSPMTCGTCARHRGLKYFSTTHLALFLVCLLFAQRSIFRHSR